MRVLSSQLRSLSNEFIDTIQFNKYFSVFKLFKKYKLEDYFKNYIQTKVFPTKLVWKRTVSNAINSLATSERLSRMEQDSNFTQFKNVHTDSIFSGWLYARMTVELSNVYFLAKLATCVRAPTTLKSEGEVTFLSGADKREVRDNREKW